VTAETEELLTVQQRFRDYSSCCSTLTLMMMMCVHQEKSKDMKGTLLFVEGKGLLNCQVIVEMYTDRPKRARQEIQHVLKKFGYLACIV